jgi:hypothetical protein
MSSNIVPLVYPLFCFLGIVQFIWPFPLLFEKIQLFLVIETEPGFCGFQNIQL